MADEYEIEYLTSVIRILRADLAARRTQDPNHSDIPWMEEAIDRGNQRLESMTRPNLERIELRRHAEMMLKSIAQYILTDPHVEGMDENRFEHGPQMRALAVRFADFRAKLADS